MDCQDNLSGSHLPVAFDEKKFASMSLFAPVLRIYRQGACSRELPQNTRYQLCGIVETASIAGTEPAQHRGG